MSTVRDPVISLSSAKTLSRAAMRSSALWLAKTRQAKVKPSQYRGCFTAAVLLCVFCEYYFIVLSVLKKLRYPLSRVELLENAALEAMLLLKWHSAVENSLTGYAVMPYARRILRVA